METIPLKKSSCTMKKTKEYTGKRDPRFVTKRRGGTLDNQHHYLLAGWGAKCAEHVLQYFSNEHPTDNRPKDAIDKAFFWSRDEISMTEAGKQLIWLMMQ
jgi:hypothetical protein